MEYINPAIANAPFADGLEPREDSWDGLMLGGPKDPRSVGSLDALFCPRSIAIVGASNVDGKAGYAVMQALSAFRGDLFPVNPRTEEIGGRRCFPSVASIGRPIDLAILVVPAEVASEVITNCVQGEIRAAVVCAGGFAETPHGSELQSQLVAAASKNGIRLLGPNTSGFLNPIDGVFATFVPSATSLLPGTVSIVARSGGVNLASCFLSAQEGIGIRLGVGLGNAADVSYPDVLDFLGEDENTKAVGLHLEGISEGRALCNAIRRLSERKPVVALKVGRAEVGEFARSHTGALMGDFDLAYMALKQSGAVMVKDLGELVDALGALSRRRLPPKQRPGIGLVTAQAGPGLIIADELASASIAVPELCEATTTAIGHLLPPLTWIRNPVDTGRPETSFSEVIFHVGADPAIDALVVYALDEPGALAPAESLQLSGVLADLPVIFGTGGPPQALAETRDRLTRLGVSTYSDPSRAARAARALALDSIGQWRLSTSHSLDPQLMMPVVHTPVVRTLDENEAKNLLDSLGLRTPKRIICRDTAEALDAFNELKVPIVVKVLNSEIEHKSDAGGVHLGVHDHASVLAALQEIDNIPTSKPSRYLLEEQASRGAELIVGGLRDSSFGSTVLLSLGGVDVAIIGAPHVRLAPLTWHDASDLIDELPRALFETEHGQFNAARTELIHVLLTISRLLEGSPLIKEMDLNPIRLTAGGLVVLDALVICDLPSVAT